MKRRLTLAAILSFDKIRIFHLAEISKLKTVKAYYLNIKVQEFNF